MLQDTAVKGHFTNVSVNQYELCLQNMNGRFTCVILEHLSTLLEVAGKKVCAVKPLSTLYCFAQCRTWRGDHYRSHFRNGSLTVPPRVCLFTAAPLPCHARSHLHLCQATQAAVWGGAAAQEGRVCGRSWCFSFLAALVLHSNDAFLMSLVFLINMHLKTDCCILLLPEGDVHVYVLLFVRQWMDSNTVCF